MQTWGAPTDVHDAVGAFRLTSKQREHGARTEGLLRNQVMKNHATGLDDESLVGNIQGAGTVQHRVDHQCRDGLICKSHPQVALFRWQGTLWFRVGDRGHVVDDTVETTWAQLAAFRSRFVMRVASVVWFEQAYDVPHGRLDEVDLSYEIGRDDFLHWVDAILRPPAGRGRLFVDASA